MFLFTYTNIKIRELGLYLSLALAPATGESSYLTFNFSFDKSLERDIREESVNDSEGSFQKSWTYVSQAF